MIILSNIYLVRYEGHIRIIFIALLLLLALLFELSHDALTMIWFFYLKNLSVRCEQKKTNISLYILVAQLVAHQLCN